MDEKWTYKPGIECVFVVLWCLLRSASRAKTFLHPPILHGQVPVSDFFFEPPEEPDETFFFPSFLSSGYKHTDGVSASAERREGTEAGSHRGEDGGGAGVAEVAEAIIGPAMISAGRRALLTVCFPWALTILHYPRVLDIIFSN